MPDRIVLVAELCRARDWDTSATSRREREEDVGAPITAKLRLSPLPFLMFNVGALSQ